MSLASTRSGLDSRRLTSFDTTQFQITRDNTAVIEWWTQRKADLTEVDGPADGWAWDCVVQEVDIETSELRFEWRVQDHLHPTETGYRLRDGQTGQTPHAGEQEFDEPLQLKLTPLLLFDCSL